MPARRQLLISHSQSQLKKSTDTASVCTSDLNPLFGSKEKSINDGEPVRVREGDLDGSGALLSGERVNLQLTAAGADLNNVSGTIAGVMRCGLTRATVSIPGLGVLTLYWDSTTLMWAAVL